MNYLCELRTVFRHAIRIQSSTRLTVANYSKNIEIKDDEIYDEDKVGKLTASEALQDEVNLAERAEYIEQIRNKSRLNKTHRNAVMNLPIPDEMYPWDKTLYYSRQQYGKFGSKTGIDPRLCFFTKEELADKQEYERVAYPYTIQEMVEANKKAKAEKQAQIKAREYKIAQNLMKLDKWMEDLKQRVAKKEQEAIAAKKKREELLEDIRQEFGFKIDFKDPRFQALMEKKELEAKKAKKAAKKAKQEQLLHEKLKKQAAEALEAENKEKENADTITDDKLTAKEDKLEKKATKNNDDSSSSDSDSSDDDDNDKKN